MTFESHIDTSDTKSDAFVAPKTDTTITKSLPIIVKNSVAGKIHIPKEVVPEPTGDTNPDVTNVTSEPNEVAPETVGGTLPPNEGRVERPPLSEAGKVIKRIFDEKHPVGLSADFIGGRMGLDGNDIIPALRALKMDGYASPDKAGVWRWMP